MDIANYEKFVTIRESHEEYGRVHKGLLTTKELTKATKDSDISNYELRVLLITIVQSFRGLRKCLKVII